MFDMSVQTVLKVILVFAGIAIVSCGSDHECTQEVESRQSFETPVYVELSLDELIADADLIVVGSIGVPEPRHVRVPIPGGERTTCRWKIAFDVPEPEVLNGVAIDELTVLVIALANKTNEPQVRAYDVHVQQGQRLLLFLREFEGGIGYAPVAGPQGAWRIEDGVAVPGRGHLRRTSLDELRERIAAAP